MPVEMLATEKRPGEWTVHFQYDDGQGWENGLTVTRARPFKVRVT